MGDKLTAAEVAALMLQLPVGEQDTVFSAVGRATDTVADPQGRAMYESSAALALALFEEVKRLDAAGLNALLVALQRFIVPAQQRMADEQGRRKANGEPILWPPALTELLRPERPTPETYAALECARAGYDREAFSLAPFADLFEAAKPLRFTPIPRGGGFKATD